MWWIQTQILLHVGQKLDYTVAMSAEEVHCSWCEICSMLPYDRQTELLVSAVGEMDALLTSQNSLIKRLKEECCELLTRVEEVTEKNRSGFGSFNLLVSLV